MSIVDDAQKQEVADSLIELYEITVNDSTDVFYFTNGLDFGADSDGMNIHFPDPNGTVMNEYIAIPCQISGIEVTGTGPSNRPELSIANIPVLSRLIGNDGDGYGDEETLKDYLESQDIVYAKDLLGSRVVYRKTLLSYTYSPSDTAEVPTEFPSQTFIIDRIAEEQSAMVKYELSAPIDLEVVSIPYRKVSQKYCSWEYQGYAKGCGGCLWPLNSNGLFLDVNNNILATSATQIATWANNVTYSTGAKVKYEVDGGYQIFEAITAIPANRRPDKFKSMWARIDICGKTVNSCKARFQKTSSYAVGTSIDFEDLDTSHPLPFGGFPGARKMK